MHIIIYESSSHGGCYKYAIELFRAYGHRPESESVTLCLPCNAKLTGSGIRHILLSDGKTGNKLHFLWRHFANPLIFLSHLISQKRSLKKQSATEPAIFVLFNDFEQMSASLWAPLFRWLLKGVRFGVFLHDADRDAYPPTPGLSAWCMKQMMKTMHLGLYHGHLPQRSYYLPNGITNYLRVEHGLYQPAVPDKLLQEQIATWRGSIDGIVLIIPGHIRKEKNYEAAIRAIQQIPGMGLIIAGSAASSSESTHELRKLAQSLGVAQQILWIEKYLSEEEMSAAMLASDVVLLYYASSFHAQSGILNQVAPLRKPVITGRLNNALTYTVERFALGWVIEADNEDALKNCLTSLHPDQISPKWDSYFEKADWNLQAEKVMNKLTHL